MTAATREELAARVLGVQLVDLRDRIRAPMDHPMKTNLKWWAPDGEDAKPPKRDGFGHAEDCPAIARLGYQAECRCNGGNYVAGRRGTRQLGEYDG